MGLISAYLIFAIATGLAVHILVTYPALQYARTQQPDNKILSSLTINVTLLIGQVIAAPILLPVLLIPNMEKPYTSGILKSLLDVKN